MFERSPVREGAEEDMEADTHTNHGDRTYHSGADDDDELDSSRESDDDEDGSICEETDQGDAEVSGVDLDSESDDSSYVGGDTSSEDSGSEEDPDDVDGIEKAEARTGETGSVVSEKRPSIAASKSIKPIQFAGTVGTLTGRLPNEKSIVVSAWKDILASFADVDYATGGMEAAESETQDLPPLPEKWTTDLITLSADIDLTRVSRALEVLHGSMRRMLEVVSVPDIPIKRDRSVGLLQNPADFDKRVENLMRTSPGLIRMKGGSDAEQSAQTKVSREIIQKLAPDEEKVALAKIERLTKEIVAYAKLTGRKRFPLSRAKHYAMLEVASSLVDNGDFENRVKADARMWTRKSDWFATHVEEATEAFKRSVASNILEAISEQESPAVEAKLDQSSKKYLKQWKADASRSLSDRQISQKFSLYRKDALIVLAAEHVSEVTRYRAERSSKGELITSNKGGAPARRRTQEYRIAFKVTANLEAKILDDCLLRAEALAVALTEVYIQVKKGRKPGRVNFMDIIVPFDDQNSARSSERDASEDDETSNNGEKLLEGDNPEMPAAKRLKTATFDERRI